MSKFITVVAIVIVGIAALFGAFFSFNNYIYQEKQAPNPLPLPVIEEVQKDPTTLEIKEYPELGFKFAYITGNDGYTLMEPEAAVEDGPIKTFMLVHANDKAAIENPPQGGEGPATITIQVFENTEKQFPRQWADAHAAYSNIGLIMGDVAETVVGGANAIRYKADGLYATNIAVVAHGEKMYVIQGAYRAETDPTARDFEPLLNTITFIPEPGQE